MRLNTSKKVHYDAGPNMTPLVDVVMVILIFLMLVGSFGGAEWYLLTDQMVSPVGAQSDSKVDAPKKKLVITVDQYGPYYVARPAGLAPIKSNIGEDEAFSALSSELKSQYDNYKTAGAADEVQIEIIPAATVPLSDVIAVFSACNEAGFSKIGFGVPGAHS